MRTLPAEELGRRQFLKRAAVVAAALPVLPFGCAATRNSVATGQAAQSKGRVPGREWAGAADGPPNPSWRATVVGAGEPGEPLVLSGTIFQPDGATPAGGVTLYVYHTDARGYYSNEPAAGGPPAPRLRGWMRTGADGRYEFRTIKPGGYPGRPDPVHVHATLSGPGYEEYWVDSYWFEDDPRVTAAYRSKLTGRGGFNPVIALRRDEQGLLRGARDLRLGRV